MTKVTKESLASAIRRLEDWQYIQGLSLREEYQLEAYRMLLDRLEVEAAMHDVLNSPTPAAGEKLKDLMTRKPRYERKY